MKAPGLRSAKLPKPDTNVADHLDEILSTHRRGAYDDAGAHANLSSADLSGIDLHNINLAATVMTVAVLRAAKRAASVLSMVDLSWANLAGCGLAPGRHAWCTVGTGHLDRREIDQR